MSRRGIPTCATCSKRLYPDHPTRMKYCSNLCAKGGPTDKRASHRELVELVLAANPVATRPQIAAAAGLTVRQVSRAGGNDAMTMQEMREAALASLLWSHGIAWQAEDAA